jgi:hypothetical protein
MPRLLTTRRALDRLLAFVPGPLDEGGARPNSRNTLGSAIATGTSWGDGDWGL